MKIGRRRGNCYGSSAKKSIKNTLPINSDFKRNKKLLNLMLLLLLAMCRQSRPKCNTNKALDFNRKYSEIIMQLVTRTVHDRFNFGWYSQGKYSTKILYKPFPPSQVKRK